MINAALFSAEEVVDFLLKMKIVFSRITMQP